MMVMMIRKLLILVFYLFQSIAFGQAINDFGTWWGAQVRKTFLKDFRVSVAAEVRLNENSSFVKNFYVSPAFRYQPLKWLYIGTSYRFDNRYEAVDRYFNQRHRIAFDLGFMYDVKRFELEYRTRFQMHWENYFSSKTDYPVMYSRNRLAITYKWPQLPLNTSLSGELWLPIETNTELNRFRIILAQEYRLKKIHRFQLRFIFQTDLNTPTPVRDYILSVRYIFAF